MKIFKRLAHKIGRRGAFLGFLAVLFCASAYVLWVPGTPLLGVSYPAIHGMPIDLILPAKAWAVTWLVVGLICAIQAFARMDRIAFSLAVTLESIWAVIMLHSWLFTQTNPRGGVPFMVWTALAAVTAIISDWPEYIQANYGDGK